MEEKDKIYELFRRNEHKLSRKPSQRAWERLDSRLDRHQQNRHRGGTNSGWLKYSGMVAAVLIMVFTASVLTINTQMGEKAQFASADEEMMAGELQDLPSMGEKSSFLKIVQYQKEYQNHFARKVTEGEVNWVLKPREENTTTIYKGEAIASNDIIEKDEIIEGIGNEKLRKNESNSLVSTGAITSNGIDGHFGNDEILLEDKQQVMSNMTSVKIQEDIAVRQEIDAMSKEDVFMFNVKTKDKESAQKESADIAIAEENIFKDQKVAASKPTPMPASPVMPTATSTGNGAYVQEMESTTTKESSSEAAADKEVEYELNAEEGFSMMDEVAENEGEGNSMSIFNWLLGEWKENTSNGESKEEWVKIDDSTLVGQGSLVTNGVTIFSEKMEIRKIGDDFYMFITLDNSNKKTKYELVSHNNRMLLFENKKVDFPNQLVLYKNSKNNFTTTLQNSLDSNNAPGVGNYLQQRNQLVNQKISRNLKRVK